MMLSTQKVAEDCIRQLLEADVLDNTFGTMIRLKNSLGLIAKADSSFCELLLRLSTESIREALHKSEIKITNEVISEKNRILKANGFTIPEDHLPVDLNKFQNYSW